MFNFDNETYNRILKKFYRYLQNIFKLITEIAFLIAFAIIIYIIILYCAKYLWYLFNSTVVGHTYAEHFYYNYKITNDVLSRNIYDLSINITVTSFIICFLVSALCQLFFISRYLYSGRGSFSRIIFLGLPLTYVVAIYIMPVYEFSNIETAFMVALVPTLCVFMECFNLSDQYIPELDDIIRKIIKAGKLLFRKSIT